MSEWAEDGTLRGFWGKWRDIKYLRKNGQWPAAALHDWVRDTAEKLQCQIGDVHTIQIHVATEYIAYVEKILGETYCCTGTDCGCQGSTVGEMEEYAHMAMVKAQENRRIVSKLANISVFPMGPGVPTNEQTLFVMQTTENDANALVYQDVLDARAASCWDNCPDCGGEIDHKRRDIKPKWKCTKCGKTGKY